MIFFISPTRANHCVKPSVFTHKNLIFRFICLLSLLFLPSLLWAQKVVSEQGVFKMKVEKSVSELQAEKYCIEHARIDAIEKAFGQTIVQGNSTYIKNERTGSTTESKTVFNLMSESLVNGEWVEDIKPPKIDKEFIDGELWMTATVYGKIREIKEVPIMFKSSLLSCPSAECKTTTFNNKQSVYLSFVAPEDGYISVYCDVPDEHTTYRMLPYKADQNISSYPVKADQAYLFFYPKASGAIQQGKVDDFTFLLARPNTPEVNKVFILFRPKNEIPKPLLSNGKPMSDIQLEMPLNIESEAFKLWLQKLRRAASDIQLESIVVSIEP